MPYFRRPTMQRGSHMGTFRIGARTLARQKRFVFFASASIAITLGICLAFLAVLDALLWRPIDAPQAQQLVDLSTRLSDGRRQGLSIEAVVALTEDSPVFSGVVAWTESAAVVELGGASARGTLLAATGNIFDFLGTIPAAGRLLEIEDGGLLDIGRPANALVLGHAFWRRVYGADPAVVGQTAVVKGLPMRVVGVAPPGFRGFSATSEPDLIVSIPAFAALAGPDAVRMRDPHLYWLTVTARLVPEATVAAADDYLRSRWRALTSASTSSDGLERRLEVTGAATGYAPMARATYGRALYIALASGVLALVIASVNVATLILARTAGRIGEYRLKFALGASFGRLAKDTVSETACIVAVSVLLGLVVRELAVRVVWQWMSSRFAATGRS